MRIVFTFICLLALAVMGCSETTGDGGSAGAGGTGGMGGEGGNGGVGGEGGTGGGGVVTDCTGVDFRTPCTVGDSPGVCFEDACRPWDCSGFENGTRCAREVGGPGFSDVAILWCWDDSCGVVGDCNGIEDLTPCSVDPIEGFCVEDSCEPAVNDCAGQEDGTLCREPPDVFGGGFCLGGVCEVPQ